VFSKKIVKLKLGGDIFNCNGQTSNYFWSTTDRKLMPFKAVSSSLFQYKNKIICLSTAKLFFPSLLALCGQLQKNYPDAN